MRVTIYSVLLAVLSLVSSITNAEVIVDSVTATDTTSYSYSIGPGQYVAIPLPSTTVAAENTYHVEISSTNALYKDVTAYIVDEDNKRLFEGGSQFQGIGYTKGMTPFTITGSLNTPGQHYLILDNTYAAFITKKLSISVKAAFPTNENTANAIKANLEQIYDALKKEFVFKDFNIHVQPCGQVNAFSETFGTGDIHICTELLDNISKTKNTGAFEFILLHELGHTLLGLWGLPGNNNEDIADEFSTFMMLQGNAAQGVQLDKSLDFWRNRDSNAEAMNMVKYGDRHSLSVQRIRDIEENIMNSSRFCKRWAELVYPHMTSDGLQGIVAHPNGCSNLELAQSILGKNATSVAGSSAPSKTAGSIDVAQKHLSHQQFSNSKSAATKLKALKELKDQGVITQEDFDKKKKEILDSM